MLPFEPRRQQPEAREVRRLAALISSAAELAPDEAAARPRVTVLIPTYNRAPLLREAIESALAQDWPALEVLVVDDGSTDGTAAVLDSYGERIRTLRQPRNAGVAAARAAGLAAARGELIQFLDSDDLLLPQSVALKVAAFAARPQAGLCLSELRYEVLETGEERRRRRFVPFGAPSCASRAPEAALIGRFLMMPSCVMVPRHLALAVGGFDPRLRLHEDRLFYGRLGLAGTVCLALDRPLSRVRVGRDSLSQNLDRQHDSLLVGFLLLQELLPRPELWWLAHELAVVPHWQGNWAAFEAMPAESDQARAFEALLAALLALAEAGGAGGASPRPLAAELLATLARMERTQGGFGDRAARLRAVLVRLARAAPPPQAADLALWRRALDPAQNAPALGLLFAALSRDLRRGRPWGPLAELDGRPFRSLAHPARRRWRLLAKVARVAGEAPARSLARLIG